MLYLGVAWYSDLGTHRLSRAHQSQPDLKGKIRVVILRDAEFWSARLCASHVCILCNHLPLYPVIMIPLTCLPFTSECTEIYSTPLPAQPKPLDWWSESWENDKWPAPNFQAGQHIHIPHVWWLIEINLGYSRATMGYSRSTHTLFQFLLALTLGFSLGWSCSTPWHVFFFFFCHIACESLVPWPGIEPAPPALEARNLSYWTTREVSRHDLWNWPSPFWLLEFSKDSPLYCFAFSSP